jgi:hypothetical protein
LTSRRDVDGEFASGAFLFSVLRAGRMHPQQSHCDRYGDGIYTKCKATQHRTQHAEHEAWSAKLLSAEIAQDVDRIVIGRTLQKLMKPNI